MKASASALPISGATFSLNDITDSTRFSPPAPIAVGPPARWA